MESSGSSSTPQPGPHRNPPATDVYYVHDILLRAGTTLKEARSRLEVTLDFPLPKLPQLVAATLPVLSSSEASDVDVWVTHRLSDSTRAKLREMALEMQPLLMRDANTQGTQSLPIHTTKTLASTDLPRRLTTEQRQKLKTSFQDVLGSNENPSRPNLFLPVTTEDSLLPSVQGKIRVTAIDNELDMPEANIKTMDCLWDTGAQWTIVSDDLLGLDFRDFIYNDPINEPYKATVERAGHKVVKVQVSAIVQMSNDVIKLDTIALVMPREAIPNQRSGVIIGQRAAINRVQYTSIPRSIMEAEGRDPGEGYWGVFEVTKYLDVDGSVVRV